MSTYCVCYNDREFVSKDIMECKKLARQYQGARIFEYISTQYQILQFINRGGKMVKVGERAWQVPPQENKVAIAVQHTTTPAQNAQSSASGVA